MTTKLLISLLVVLFLFNFTPAFAQQATQKYLAGSILDVKSDLPIAGITIRLKENGKLFLSDESGQFTISFLNLPVTLELSGTGYQSKKVTIETITADKIVIRMSPDFKKMDEVVLTNGYQNLPKERITGSFEIFDNKKINLRVSSDILSRLEGISTSVLFDRRGMNGVQNIVTPQNIMIRGLSTITESTKTPLIILNNFPYEGDISNINPNDIENISILKDAAAASIWGARAANGVIVLTTKKGQFRQPAHLSYNANFTFFQKPDLFYYPHMSTKDFIGVEKYLFSKGFYNADLNNTYSFPALTPVVEILARQRSGDLSDEQANDLIEPLENIDVRNDFENYIYRRGLNQQHSLNLSGGSEHIKYSLSAGFDKATSYLIGNDNKRITLRSENTFSPVKGLEVKAGIFFTGINGTGNSLGDWGSAAYNYRIKGKSAVLFPYAKFADDNGIPMAVVHDYRQVYADTAGGGKLLDWRFIPLNEIKLGDNHSKNEDILINSGLRYQLFPTTSIELNYQYQHTYTDAENYKSNDTYYTRDLINTFTQMQGISIQYIVPNAGILNQSKSDLTSELLRGQVNYSKVFSKVHEVDAIAGGEITERGYTSHNSQTYGFNKNNLSFAAVDYVNFYPQYGGLSYGQIPYNENFEKTLNRFVSFYANASYTYKSRYTFSASGRKDASNLFGVNTNNKWKPFWSVGGSWNMSKEKFFKSKLFSDLKLRATYGFQGNVNNSITPNTLIMIVGAVNSIIGQPQGQLISPADPDLSWENISQINLGIDFQTIKNRLSGTLEIYKKESNNLIFSAATDHTTGIWNVYKNSAGIKAEGVELTLNSRNLTGVVGWNSSFLISYVKNIVTDYLLSDQGRSISGFVSNSGLSIMAIKGKDPYAVYSYPFAGLDPTTGDPLGYLGKTVSKDYRAIQQQSIDTANLIYHGSGLPRWFGSLNNSFSFKKITLTASISFKLGYYFRKSTINYYSLYNNGRTHPDFEKRWQSPGDENFTTVPSMVYPVSSSYRDDFYAGTAANVLKGDNIRLQFIRLSYDIHCRKNTFQNLQLYVYLNNPGLLWIANKENLDPDYNTRTSLYPPVKSIALGAKIDF